ncbi:MAG: hypothetical protein JW731_07810 [Bacteroidales bacterium]|nr:hypothetical protein [Bacteroidales bacterium]
MLVQGNIYSRDQIVNAGFTEFKTNDTKISVYLHGTSVYFFNIVDQIDSKLKLILVCDN